MRSVESQTWDSVGENIALGEPDSVCLTVRCLFIDSELDQTARNSSWMTLHKIRLDRIGSFLKDVEWARRDFVFHCISEDLKTPKLKEWLPFYKFFQYLMAKSPQVVDRPLSTMSPSAKVSAQRLFISPEEKFPTLMDISIAFVLALVDSSSWRKRLATTALQEESLGYLLLYPYTSSEISFLPSWAITLWSLALHYEDLPEPLGTRDGEDPPPAQL